MGLTRSIRKLTRKLRQIPDTSMVHPETIQLNQLLSNVTSPRDRETHELEQVFNHLMTRLHESTTNEMTLREGTLQAQLNALQAQINPHFIYNTLNIISAKSMESSNSTSSKSATSLRRCCAIPRTCRPARRRWRRKSRMYTTT